jgi:hypothetical protein
MSCESGLVRALGHLKCAVDLADARKSIEGEISHRSSTGYAILGAIEVGDKDKANSLIELLVDKYGPFDEDVTTYQLFLDTRD